MPLWKDQTWPRNQDKSASGKSGAVHETRLPSLELSKSEWLNVSASVFTNANPNLTKNPQLPSVDDPRRIQVAVTTLISDLNAAPTPTAPIEETAAAFRAQLSEVIREIGRYDATPEATTRIVQASNIAAKVGQAHKVAIEDYLGSAVSRLLGAF